MILIKTLASVMSIFLVVVCVSCYSKWWFGQVTEMVRYYKRKFAKK